MANPTKPDWAKVNDDGSVTITLSKPIEVNGAKLAKLTMREPMVGDSVANDEVRGSDVVKEIALFSNLCTVAPADLHRLTQRDYMRLQAAYTANFFD